MKPTFFASPLEFRAWLVEHHATETELWVGFHKRATGKPSLTWPESVDEALCAGWIDGLRNSVDEGRYAIRFTPRKPTSTWSAVNIARMKVLTKQKRVLPAGKAAFARRSDARSQLYSYEQRGDAAFDAGAEKTFRENAGAWAFFEKQAPWYRRTSAYWVMTAKKADTRERRLAELIARCADGQPIKALAGAKVRSS